MKVSILSHDLSRNCLGRAHIIARLLAQEFDVTIFGPASRGAIWGPLQDQTDVNIVILDSLRDLKRIDGDVIYAIKPHIWSLVLGKYISCKRRRPLVVDIDDWDLGFLKAKQSTWLNVIKSIKVWNLENYIYLTICEWIARHNESKTASSKFTRERFQADLVIPQCRDSQLLNPDIYDVSEIRSTMGIQETNVIMFLGTPRKHKGIDLIIQALDYLERADILLLIYGADSDFKREYQSKRAYLRVHEAVPYSQLPGLLAAADMVVIPQEDSLATVAQMPFKLFDAMAMGKPIIASAVSDIPDVLNGVGILIRPGDHVQLAREIAKLVDNPVGAVELGKKARQKYIANYSEEKYRDIICSYLSKICLNEATQ